MFQNSFLDLKIHLKHEFNFFFYFGLTIPKCIFGFEMTLETLNLKYQKK